MKFARPLVLIVLCNLSFVMAEEARVSVKKNMSISVEPASILIGQIPVRYSIGITDTVALGVSAYGQFFAMGSDHKIFGVGGGVDSKFNLSGKNYSDSWYIKPGLYLGYFSSLDIKAPSIAGFVTGGYSWVFKSGFIIDLGLGLQYRHVFVSVRDKLKGFGLSGILPSLDLALGFAF